MSHNILFINIFYESEANFPSVNDIKIYAYTNVNFGISMTFSQSVIDFQTYIKLRTFIQINQKLKTT